MSALRLHTELNEECINSYDHNDDDIFVSHDGKVIVLATIIDKDLDQLEG